MIRKLLSLIDRIEDACRPDRGYHYSTSVDIADSIGLIIICILLLSMVFM